MAAAISAPKPSGSAQHRVSEAISRARAWAAAAATRARSGSNRSRSPSPTRISRRPSAWMSASSPSFGRASPDSASAARAPEPGSPGGGSPSKKPTTIVSAPVARGSPVLASTCTAAHAISDYDWSDPSEPGGNAHEPGAPADAKDRDPVRRANADREAGRWPLDARGHRARRDGDQGRAGARRGGARAGPARRDGAGPPGRPGPDPLPAGPDQGGHPPGGLLGDDQQGLRLGHPRLLPDRQRDPRRRPGRRR